LTAATPASETWQTAAPERRARLHVDLEAVRANWRTFQALAPTAQAAAVVKANAYGLGAGAVANALAAEGCRTFFTATFAEGAAVRAALGPGPEIIVLNGVAAEAPPDAFARFALTACLNCAEDLAAWTSDEASAPAPVLHIDTGMNRLGFRVEDAPEARRALADAGVTPSLVMSHLACASDPAHPMNEAQRIAFEGAAAAFPGIRRSLAASAGTQLGPAYHYDLIRPGIGLYGWDGMDAPTTPLRPAARVTAPVLQVRTVRAGETCGYGATVTAHRDTRAVIVAAGYADGFLRAASGRGYAAAVGDARLPLLGRVSMDLLILDAEAAPGLRVGDMVELLGPRAPLSDTAAAMGTLAYEVLTTLAGQAERAPG
jgi:alanine racemase